jgi:uncharacterized surface protein with fasciclin (FAS1) repeats
MDYKSSNHGMTAIGIIVALVIGAGGGYAVAKSMQPDTMTNKTSNSTNSSMMSQGDGTKVGGALMVKDKDIVDNAANASNVTTVVSLVKLAGLVDTLKSDGPFTVFGPNNDAFAKIDKATVESLQKPENVAMLKNILTYHVVPGTYTSADLRVMAQKGETLTTVQGETLTPMLEGNAVVLKDAKGGMAEIETADIISSNGVTHVIKSVLMPAS